jgi:two-component system phosphate regulon sensor histidine kinase PhoR
MNQPVSRHLIALAAVSLVILTAALFSPGHALMFATGLAAGAALWRFMRSKESTTSAPPPLPLAPGPAPGNVLDALPQPVFLVDKRCNVVVWNATAAKAFPGLAAGAPLAFAVRSPPLIDAVNATLVDTTTRSVEVIERASVGRAFSATVTNVESGLPAMAAVILRETTQERAVEAMRADFVANASHELRTPLATIIGFVETLRGAARNDAVAREKFLDIIYTQARRMARLIDDLLSLSRIELKEHIAPSERVDLGQIVRDVSLALSEVARENGVELALKTDTATPVVQGDHDELASVVENLIENAIKYGKSGKRVEVRLSDTPDGQLQLSVRDFGPGIPPQALPRLTERFYRVDNALSRSEGGTGLGLALVKHTVNRHRGRLEIESTLGEGTRATVTLRKASVPSAS